MAGCLLAASAGSQTVRYTVPAASVGDDFSAYHQALDSAADFTLLSSKRLISAETRAYVRAVTAAAHLPTNNSLPGCSAAEMLRIDDFPLTVQ